MTSKVKLTKEFTLDIPLEEIRSLLIQAGYDVPEDAKFYIHPWTYDGQKRKLSLFWTREENAGN